MSTSQVLAGAFVIGGALNLAISAALPDISPIVVHDLSYAGGVVYQDRTVTTAGSNTTFPARWSAFVVDTRTGLPVDACAGEGFWAYPEGRKTYPIPLPDWVGSEACTASHLREHVGPFKLVAAWHWGNDETTFESEAFRP